MHPKVRELHQQRKTVFLIGLTAVALLILCIILAIASARTPEPNPVATAPAEPQTTASTPAVESTPTVPETNPIVVMPDSTPTSTPSTTPATGPVDTTFTICLIGLSVFLAVRLWYNRSTPGWWNW